MKKSNGFTLIELLGVIILLGLVLTIIFPKLSSSIEQAKKNSAADSALSYIKSARDYYNANILNTDFPFKEGKNYLSKIDSYVDVNGDRPMSGYITISDDKIVYAKLCVNYYNVIYSSGDAKVDGSCTGDESESLYTSYVAGASKAYIYINPGVFNTESQIIKNPPNSTLIVYVDSQDKVLKAYWGYVFDSTNSETIQNYETSISSYTGPMASMIEKNNYLILEELSVVYILENNTYFNATKVSPIDYTLPLATVVTNLRATFFGGGISPTVYKTIEF